MAATLADVGVTDIIISPGSRNTPFIVALTREPRLRCHTVIDERAAGYVALGMSRVSGRATALLCTSGTAPAHYFPAVIEASLSGVPMLVLSADRPHELQHCAAPQTIDQTKLFGDYVRRAFDVSAPDEASSAWSGFRRILTQAVADTAGPWPGPVHVNLRARKPLEPVAPTSPDEHELAGRVDTLLRLPAALPRRPTLTPHPEQVAYAAEILARHERGILVVGPALLERRLDLQAIEALARATGFPVYVEATGQLRFAKWSADTVLVPTLDLVLRSHDAGLAPSLIVQLGRPPVFEIQARLQAGAQAGVSLETLTIEPFGWVDPSGSATAVLVCDVAEGARALVDSLPVRTSRRYAEAVAAADAAARRLVRASLADGTFAEGHVVATVFEHLPPDSAVVLGNSLSVRVVDSYVLDADPSVLVLHQRGTSGIECNLALAYGAHRALGRTTTLLYGDISLLHDLGSFFAVRDAQHLVVIVLNNQGGRIFEQLPLARVADLEAEVFSHVLTPHSMSFEAVAPLASATYHRVEDATQLHTALTLAYAGTGVHLVEVCLAPSGGYAQNAALWRAAATLP